jgi:hypothetical protein
LEIVFILIPQPMEAKIIFLEYFELIFQNLADPLNRRNF